jgi:hypothetical protein
MRAKYCSRHPLTMLGMTECSRGSSVSLELVNRPENQWFLTRSNSAPGFAFFEPVPTVLSRCAFCSTESTTPHFPALHVIPVADSKKTMQHLVVCTDSQSGDRRAWGRAQAVLSCRGRCYYNRWFSFWALRLGFSFLSPGSFSSCGPARRFSDPRFDVNKSELRTLTEMVKKTGWRQVLLFVRRWVLTAPCSAFWCLPRHHTRVSLFRQFMSVHAHGEGVDIRARRRMGNTSLSCPY